MTKGGPKGPSRVDRYLPRWAIEEVLRTPRPGGPAPGTPHVVVVGRTGQRPVVAEPLAGGCLLCRLPGSGG